MSDRAPYVTEEAWAVAAAAGWDLGVSTMEVVAVAGWDLGAFTMEVVANPFTSTRTE